MILRVDGLPVRGVNCVCFGSQGTARIFLLTKKSVVLADQKTGQVKASVPLPDLASVSVSTQSDGFFALKLKEVKRKACCGLSHFCQSCQFIFIIKSS